MYKLISIFSMFVLDFFLWSRAEKFKYADWPFSLALFITIFTTVVITVIIYDYIVVDDYRRWNSHLNNQVDVGIDLYQKEMRKYADLKLQYDVLIDSVRASKYLTLGGDTEQHLIAKDHVPETEEDLIEEIRD